MLCKGNWGKKGTTAAVILGIVSFLFGILTFLIGKPEGHALNTLLGMFTGFGFGIIAVAVIHTIRAKVVPKEKLEQEQIDREDERNVTIMQKAGQIGFYMAMALLIVLIFLFMGLGYTVPSYICLGAMYVLVFTVLIARKFIAGRM